MERKEFCGNQVFLTVQHSPSSQTTRWRETASHPAREVSPLAEQAQSGRTLTGQSISVWLDQNTERSMYIIAHGCWNVLFFFRVVSYDLFV